MTTLFKNGKPSSPSGLKVAPQSYNSLEEIAKGLHGLLPAFPGEPYKLDCVRILEKTLVRAGYQLKIVEVADLDECAAFAIPEEYLIVFREDIYEMLHAHKVYGRSTVVHEMSHLVLKHAVTLHRGAKIGHHRHFEDSEWQAKALTAAIMMPIEACRVARSPQQLASMCGTSVETAIYRLERLAESGIISREEYAEGYQYRFLF